MRFHRGRTGSHSDRDPAFRALPAADSRPMLRWVWNDQLDAREIRAQTRQIVNAGFGSALIVPGPGLESGANAWLDGLETAIDQAHRSSLRLWLDISRPVTLSLTHALYVQFEPSQRVGQQPTAIDAPLSQFAVSFENEAAHAARPIPPDEAVTLHPGEVLVQARTSSSSDFDLFQPQALETLLRDPLQLYYREFGDQFNQVIAGFVIRIPMPAGIPWSAELSSRFEALAGHPLVEALPALAFDLPSAGAERSMVENALRQALGETLAGLARWCSNRELPLSIELAPPIRTVASPNVPLSTTAVNGSSISVSPTLATFAPGALPYTSIQPAGGSSETVTIGLAEVASIKEVTAAARSSNARAVVEILAPADDILRRLHAAAGGAIALGADRISFGALPYSIRGPRKRSLASFPNLNHPLRREILALNTAVARFTDLAASGHPAANLLVLRADGVTQSSDTRSKPSGSDPFNDVLSRLLRAGREFDIANPAVLSDSRLEGQALILGDRRYSVLIVPGLNDLPEAALSLLSNYVESGGVAVAGAGVARSRLSARVRKLLSQCSPISNLEDVLRAWPGPVDVTTDSSGAIALRTIDTGSRQLALLSNLSSQHAARLGLAFRSSGRVEEYDCDTGRTTVLPVVVDSLATHVQVELAPEEFRALSFDPAHLPDEAEAPESRSLTPTGQISLEAPWGVVVDSPRSLPLRCCTYKIGVAEWSPPAPVDQIRKLPIPPGKEAHLRFLIRIDSRIPDLKLAIEQPERWSVVLNGVPVLHRDLGPWSDPAIRTFSLSSAAIVGPNILLISGRGDPDTGQLSLEDPLLIGTFASPHIPESSNESIRILAVPGTTESLDLAAAGLDGFTENLDLRQTFQLDSVAGRQFFLEMDQLPGEAVRLFVNRREAGTLRWPRFRIDITPYVRRGGNLLRLQIVSSPSQPRVNERQECRAWVVWQ